MTPLLELVDVTRRYRDGDGHVDALRGVSLAVAAGELVLLMGPSGCGKSTLLAVAGGVEAPSAGAVSIGGKQLVHSAGARSERLRDEVGYVFQERNLLADLTAAENVALPLELGGVGAATARAAALDALDVVGLRARADTFPRSLSGGEEQRVAVARALIGDRRLLLGDEPTGALDSVTAETVMRLIRARCDAGAAAIVATHDATLAAFADRVVFLRDGVIVGSTAGVPG
jgi:putative ABC transport system ATP-binding protein